MDTQEPWSNQCLHSQAWCCPCTCPMSSASGCWSTPLMPYSCRDTPWTNRWTEWRSEQRPRSGHRVRSLPVNSSRWTLPWHCSWTCQWKWTHHTRSAQASVCCPREWALPRVWCFPRSFLSWHWSPVPWLAALSLCDHTWHWWVFL